MCLYHKDVEFDTEAQSCLLPLDEIYNWEYLPPLYVGYDRPFVSINECLENYEKKEADSTEMKLKKVNALTMYTKKAAIMLGNLVIEEEEDLEPIVVNDLPSNLTLE